MLSFAKTEMDKTQNKAEADWNTCLTSNQSNYDTECSQSYDKDKITIKSDDC